MGDLVDYADRLVTEQRAAMGDAGALEFVAALLALERLPDADESDIIENPTLHSQVQGVCATQST